MINLHEQLYRGRELLERLGRCAIAICGAGALGANLAENLARSGAKALTVIDRDRVEEHNLATQPYGRSEIGGQKAKMLANGLYRSLGVGVAVHCVELNADNVRKLVGSAELVVDCFDNSASRQCVADFAQRSGLACLHVGLSADFAEVLWDEVYRVPQVAGPDRCDYPLARNIVQLAVATASEVILNYLARQERRNYTITLADLSLRSFT